MLKFKSGAYVKVIKTRRVGTVISQYRTRVAVEFWDKSMIETELQEFRVSELEETEIPHFGVSQLKKLVRGELAVSQITEGTNILPEELEENSGEYRITVADLLAGLNVYKNQSIEAIYSWVMVLCTYEEEMAFMNEPWTDIEDHVTEKDILNYAFEEVEVILSYLYDSFYDESFSEDGRAFESPINDLIDGLKLWTESKGADYPDAIKHRIAAQYDKDNIDSQSEATQRLFKKCLDYLCDEINDPKAIQKRGYCYYCGTNIYPNDWVKARDTFIRYYNMTGDASAANTLGYIYYYGRCNGGVPEYDEAFKYFSIGHAFTYFESTYKLADMFAHGYGVVRDGVTANHLYWTVYEQNIKRFMKGDVKCNFADAALRMGNCFRDEIGASKDLETAYYYYLQADYAIRKRIDAANFYGDNVVYSGIQKALEAVRREYTIRGNTERFIYPGWTKWTLIKHRRCKMSVRELKNGVLALDVSPMKRYDEKQAPMMLITIPKADYCELKKKVRIKTAPFSKFESVSGETELIFDHVEYDWNSHTTSFYNFETLVGELYTEFYSITAPAKKKPVQAGNKYHFVSVRFERGGRVYDYLCEDTNIAQGDMVIINGYDGEKAVQVVDVFDKYESELGLPIGRYKSIVRKA